jgi:hypothetical protein
MILSSNTTRAWSGCFGFVCTRPVSAAQCGDLATLHEMIARWGLDRTPKSRMMEVLAASLAFPAWAVKEIVQCARPPACTRTIRVW